MILNPQEPVAEVLRTAGVDQVVTVTDDEQYAMAIAMSVV